MTTLSPQKEISLILDRDKITLKQIGTSKQLTPLLTEWIPLDERPKKLEKLNYHANLTNVFWKILSAIAE